ncbi:hypothetical protein [Pseudomonas sp. SDO5271_S396]
MSSLVGQDGVTAESRPVQSLETQRVIWVAAVSAAVYPWILDGFHWAVTPAAASIGRFCLAALLLVIAFAVPLVCLLLASRQSRAAGITRARRFALMAMTAPTTYVFFGVLTYMAGSKLPDTWLWTPAWLVLGFWAAQAGRESIAPRATPSASLRVAHGIAGSIAALYVLFHVFNHLFGLIGPDAHAAVMDIGRTVYRAKIVEPILVMVMLFQIVSGLKLVWTWSETSQDRYRIFQLASGVFLSVFILGHMNSVFVFARTFLDIPTDWAFATGAPTGLVKDPWNIRLVPHYALGVFFVLTHLFSGLRVVLLAHAVNTRTANRLWWAGAVFSALIALAILSGMTGLRLK